jgi:hypothetical protein
MLNKLEELIDHLNSLPAASEGFDARTLYTTGMEYGLTCKEVKDTFLGKEKALARGKYPASVSGAVLKAAAAAPVKVPKVKAPKAEKAVKAPKEPKAAKVAKAKRNTSTTVVEKKSAKDTAALASRRELIAKIAKKHKAEDKVVASLLDLSDTAKSTEADHAAIEELEKLMKSSTVNPLTA